MIAYKGMRPGMVCLGYQLRMGLNVTEQATGRYGTYKNQCRPGTPV